MTMTVRFNEKAWGRLAWMADQQGITIAELIESAAHRLLMGTKAAPRAAELQATRQAHKTGLTEMMLTLRSEGYTIAQIADETGYSTTYVSKILCANGARTRTRTDARSGQNRKAG